MLMCEVQKVDLKQMCCGLGFVVTKNPKKEIFLGAI